MMMMKKDHTKLIDGWHRQISSALCQGQKSIEMESFGIIDTLSPFLLPAFFLSLFFRLIKKYHWLIDFIDKLTFALLQKKKKKKYI